MFLLTISRLRSVVNQQLIEGRLEDAQAKYPEIDVDALARQDPSGSQLKYLSWMAKQLALGASEQDLVPTVNYFHKNMSRFPSKDIFSYKSLKDLEDAAKAASEKKSSKEKRQESKEGSEMIFEDDAVALVFVGTKESCQLYGKGTQWCITMRDASYFEQYTGANVVFYFLLRKEPKGDPFDKVAFAVKRDKENKVVKKELELYDAKDKKISVKSAERAFPNMSAYVGLALGDAQHKPKGLIAKIKDGDASSEEEREAFKLYGYEPEAMRQLIPSFRDVNILAALATDKDGYIRSFVARNPNTQPEVLKALNYTEDLHVRRGVAINPNTPLDLLKTLASDEDKDIRWNVARNPNTPPEVLKALAFDKDVNTRWFVARNPNTSSETLVILLKDKSEYTRTTAEKSLNEKQ